MVLLALALGCTFLDDPTPRGPRTGPRHGEDTAARDSGPGLDTARDTGDSGQGADTGTPETGTPDTGTPDTGTPDTSDADTSDADTSDTGTVDTGSSDPSETGTPDTATSDTSDTGWDGRDTADTGGGDTVDTSDTGTADTGATGGDGRDTSDTGTTGGDGRDTSDTGTVDTGGMDTSDTSYDTAPWGDTSTDSAPDTGVLDTGALDTSTDTARWDGRDTSADSAAGTDTSTDTGGSGGSTPMRFLAVGDAGDGSLGQRAVAAAMGDVCAAQGCDFVLFLGDNFYPIGVSSTTDPQWTTKFESVYTDPSLAIPFYAVLGNHDYGLSYTLSRAQAQVDYTAVSSRWEMADLYWSATIGDALFLGLDTEAWANEDGADQQPWADSELAGTTATWRFALGHHPYLSNGPHGDAGEWDGRAGEGESFRDFFDASLCGNIDAYFFGHDHLLQWIDAPCGVAQLGSGSGARTYSSIGSHTTRFEAVVEGFVWVEIDGRTLTTVWYDDTATELYRDTITK